MWEERNLSGVAQPHKVNSGQTPRRQKFGFELAYDKQGSVVDGGATNTYTRSFYNGNIAGSVKKYGPDGNVQKEFNKGHNHPNTPKNEQEDHVHDYKPNPNNPTGRG